MPRLPRLPRKSGGAPSPLAVHIVPRLPRKEAEPRGTPGRTSDPLAVHIVPRLTHKRGGAPRDAKAYIRPLGSAHCPTPATQKRRSPKGRQGVHPTPWQCTLSHACHAKAAEPQGRQGVHPTPWHTSEKCTVSHACHDIRPLAMHIVPRLPRKRGGAPRDARAYIQPLGSAHGPTPATQKRRRAYIRPLGSAHCPTPATQKTRSPKGRQGVHPTPWQCTLSHACHAKAAEPEGTPGRTSDPLGVHIVPRLLRKRGGARRDARVYIRPLGSAHCPTPATQKRRSPKGRQGVHPTPWQCTLSHACYAKEAEPEETPGRTSDPLAVHIVPRLPRKKRGAPRDARAHPTPWQCTLSHACHAKAAEPQGMPGRTSDPLGMHIVDIVPRLPRKRGGAPRDARAYIRSLGSAHCPTPATQKMRSPKGRQGVHPTPWQCTLSHACHAKEAEPLGNAHCPTPATQKRRSPKGRQGIHPTPWQCTLSLACHAKAAEPQGTPGRTSDPLGVHIVPRLPRKSGGAPRDARAYIRPLGNAHCPTPATQKRRSPKGRQGVHPTPWQCTLSHACHAKAAEPQGTPGRTSDPLAVHIVPRLLRKSGGAPRTPCVRPTPWHTSDPLAAHIVPRLPRKSGGE